MEVNSSGKTSLLQYDDNYRCEKIDDTKPRSGIYVMLTAIMLSVVRPDSSGLQPICVIHYSDTSFPYCLWHNSPKCRFYYSVSNMKLKRQRLETVCTAFSKPPKNYNRRFPEINIRPFLAFRPFESARTDFVMLFYVREADGHRAAVFRHRASHDELVSTLVKLFFCVTNANDK